MNQSAGIYPGTFDPITNGHMDVVRSSLNIVDKLILAVASDIAKTPLFSLKERVEMAKNDIKYAGFEDRVEVCGFSGLLINFAKKSDISIIIRGLRAVSDFEYEFQLSAMNSKLNPNIQTVFIPASESNQFVASTLVKQIATLGGDVTPFVSAAVAEKLKI